ncbi:MAG TPA: bifunctional enoyl-CoA hydratase/phosphate acetyltransferase [Kouleothrix sp.]|uniref:bifunctional enoyl-CoA hydratase/phosphate acetyltransferase n=1 Tax=Kouleothrix sp. TaxID=2779161 RepID=UPI002BD8CA97|nr:bifunctional enoyl-CoA hydratase/phosphate acetyltransferase [Kouleothrix sp.]HRC76537.1 bifunctional enoyl-CoA hydratase/phosphate acetyltransferase [Kouleothrix sp.]
MEYIENRTFDEIAVGDSASLTRTLTEADIKLFAVMSGDVNPAHLDEEYARNDMFHKIIAHGMWGGALISTLLGTQLPGPGTIYLGQTLRFRRPVAVGDTITVSVQATLKDAEKHRITFDCACVNQAGDPVIGGTAEVIAPSEKVKRPRVSLPDVHLHDHGARYRQLIAAAAGLPPIRTGVVHPVEHSALLEAIEAARAGLIVPLLIGPEAKIRAVADEAGVDIGPYQLVAVEHRNAALAKAAALARSGEADALMNGSLRPEEFLRALVDPANGLGTGHRMSHVFVLDVPTYPRPLFLTDSMMNVSPTLDDKRDIVQNAIRLARVLGIEQPKVALLSAVETINPRIRSTLDAAALCKMVERGQISGGLVDGPLGFDTAVSAEAAQAQGITSPVAGQADILVVPDLESGTMLVKQLEYLADAESAGVVLGARVPIVLTSSADNPLSRMASCAIALLLAQARHSALAHA